MENAYKVTVISHSVKGLRPGHLVNFFSTEKEASEFESLHRIKPNTLSVTMEHNVFTCHTCNQKFNKYIPGDFTGNYGRDTEGNLFCLPCCGKNDLQKALETGKWIGYLSVSEDWKPCSPDALAIQKAQEGFGKYTASNWPGTLKVKVIGWNKTPHNFGGYRTNVWFKLPGDNFIWYGYQIGDYNQILHSRRTKQTKI